MPVSSIQHPATKPAVRCVATRLRGFRRSGITLIELLITISILAILAALILGASNAATEAARRARTKTLISKIHNLVMERYGTYQTRRVDVSHIRSAAVAGGVTGTALGQVMADARLLATRELMRLEMPDRWSDVIGGVPGSVPRDPNIVLNSPPSLTYAYQRRYSDLQNRLINSEITPAQILENQSAECLYLTVMNATGDGEARTHFGDQDIGDVDGDGAPEFVDGWGNPIFFIRWPAGFAEESSLIASLDPNVVATSGLAAAQLKRATEDHDPLDPFRRDLIGQETPPIGLYPPQISGLVQAMRSRYNAQGGAYRLVPLIYSMGPDGEPDLYIASREVVVDPYASYSSGSVTAELGTPLDVPIGAADDGRNWVDNVHNHLMDNQ